MSLLHKHITVLLVAAVCSLMTHVGVYHGPDVVDGHAQEQSSGHTDFDTCIAGLSHAQPSIKFDAPTVSWIQIAVVPPLINGRYFRGVLSGNAGRAPPYVTTSIAL